MGKNSVRNRRKKKNSALSIEKIIEKAQEYIDTFEFGKAQEFCQEALKREPDNTVALETSGSLCMEMGNLDGAKHCYGRAIALQPLVGYTKYLTMAQLLEGKESLNCYIKGIDIISNGLKNLSCSDEKENLPIPSTMQVEKQVSLDENVVSRVDTLETLCEELSQLNPGTSQAAAESSMKKTLQKDLSNAHCSLAELFMTELCDEDDAEEECKKHINLAIDSDATNPEPYQHMASFLLITQKKEEAKTYISKSISLWFPQYKAILEGDAAGDPVEICPVSYQSRLAVVKTLIEVEDHETAEVILDGLVGEDDQIVDTWYLLGWNLYLQGEQVYPYAKFYFLKALKSHKVEPSPDTELVAHINELLSELKDIQEKDESDDDDDSVSDDTGNEEEDLEEENDEANAMEN